MDDGKKRGEEDEKEDEQDLTMNSKRTKKRGVKRVPLQ